MLLLLCQRGITAAAAAAAASPGAGAPASDTHPTLRETDFHGGLSEVDAQRLLVKPYVSAILKSTEARGVNALRGHLSNPGGADGPSPDLAHRQKSEKGVLQR
jgi:hypothetical protein